MARIIAITNQKGGVGKTTTSVNLAASLAVADQRVLLVDFDPQGNASSALGITREDIKEANIYHALLGQCKINDVIKKTEIENLHIAPANNDLIGAEIELVGAFAREVKLKNALNEVKNTYDFVIIDCPPSLGLLTVNALTSCDSYLIPLQCEYFALEGMSQLLSTASLIKESLNKEMVCDGVLLTMYDLRNNLSREVEKEARLALGDTVFKTVVPRNVRLSECPSFGKPIILYDVNSKGAASYIQVARELIEKLNKDNEIAPPPFKLRAVEEKKENNDERVVG